MLYIVIGLILVVCVLLVIIVLAQNSKGGGLSSSFGGSSAASMIGVQRTNDLLENLTWGFGAALMVLCVSSGFILEGEGEGTQIYESPNIDAARNQFINPAQQLPMPSAADTTEAIIDSAGGAVIMDSATGESEIITVPAE